MALRSTTQLCRFTLTVLLVGAVTLVISAHTELPLPPASRRLSITSLVVNGVPSCHLAPWRRWKVMLCLPNVQLLASSGRYGSLPGRGVLEYSARFKIERL